MNNELRHYGVLGMKWGVRKAAKSGRPYKYKSLEQKYYENKVKKLSKNPEADQTRIAKAKSKKRLYEQRDSNRESYTRQVQSGKAFVRTLLIGPINSGNYARYRAAGKDVIESSLRAGLGTISVMASGGLSIPVFLLTSRYEELATARSQLNHAELYHWGFKKDHKYIAKVKKPNGKYRYFYDKDEYEAYLNGGKDSKNEESDPFSDFMNFAKKGARWVTDFMTGGFLAPLTATLIDVPRTVGMIVEDMLDPIVDKAVDYHKEATHKYIAKVPRGDGTYRYFYDQDEYDAYLKRLEYQENEPDFMKNVVEETDENADDLEETNPNYSRSSEKYSTNCWFCSNAYELRKRGYDVEAEAMTEDKAHMVRVPLNQDLSKSMAEGMQQWYKDPVAHDVASNDIRKLDSVISNNEPKSSRGQLAILWKGGGGHSVVYEVNSSGEVTIVDSQTHTRYVSNETYKEYRYANTISERILPMSSLTDNIDRVAYARTDNLELTEGVLDVVVEDYKE